MGKFSKIAKIALGAIAGGLVGGAIFGAGAGSGIFGASFRIGGAVAGAGAAASLDALTAQRKSVSGLPPMPPQITGGAEVRRGGKTTARQYVDPATGNVITEYLPTPEEEANKTLNDKLLSMALGKLAAPGTLDAELAGLTTAFQEEEKAKLAEPFRAMEQAAKTEITRLGGRGVLESQYLGDVAKKQAEVGLSLGRQTTLLREDLRSRRQAELQYLVQLARAGQATEADIGRLNNLQAQSAREYELGLGLQRENLALGREALIAETRANKRQSMADTILGLPPALLAARDLFGFGKKV